jgi:hypothetical protein
MPGPDIIFTSCSRPASDRGQLPRNISGTPQTITPPPAHHKASCHPSREAESHTALGQEATHPDCTTDTAPDNYETYRHRRSRQPKTVVPGRHWDAGRAAEAPEPKQNARDKVQRLGSLHASRRRRVRVRTDVDGGPDGGGGTDLCAGGSPMLREAGLYRRDRPQHFQEALLSSQGVEGVLVIAKVVLDVVWCTRIQPSVPIEFGGPIEAHAGTAASETDKRKHQQTKSWRAKGAESGE